MAFDARAFAEALPPLLMALTNRGPGGAAFAQGYQHSLAQLQEQRRQAALEAERRHRQQMLDDRAWSAEDRAVDMDALNRLRLGETALDRTVTRIGESATSGETADQDVVSALARIEAQHGLRGGTLERPAPMSPKIAARQRREAEEAEARAEKERTRAEHVYERVLKQWGPEALDKAPNMVLQTPEYGAITVSALEAKFAPTATDPATGQAPPRVPALPPASLSPIEQLRRMTDPEEKKRYLADTSALAGANRPPPDPNSGSALDRLLRATPDEKARILAAEGDLSQARSRPDSPTRGSFADYEAASPERQKEILDARARYVAGTPTAEMRNRQDSLKGLVPMLRNLRAMSEKIIQRVGPAQRFNATLRGLEAVAGSDPDFRVYQDFRGGLAAMIAVATQGSRPSDADVFRSALPLIPTPYKDTRESAKTKWDLIFDMFRTRLSPEMQQQLDLAPGSAQPLPAEPTAPAPAVPTGREYLQRRRGGR